MALRGRPKKEVARDYQFTIRMTKEEFDNLENLSKKYGKSKSDLARIGLGVFDSTAFIDKLLREDD